MRPREEEERKSSRGASVVVVVLFLVPSLPVAALYDGKESRKR